MAVRVSQLREMLDQFDEDDMVEPHRASDGQITLRRQVRVVPVVVSQQRWRLLDRSINGEQPNLAISAKLEPTLELGPEPLSRLSRLKDT